MSKPQGKAFWWAASDYFAYTGPYKTQAEAWNALIAAPDIQARERTVHVAGAKVFQATEETMKKFNKVT